MFLCLYKAHIHDHVFLSLPWSHAKVVDNSKFTFLYHGHEHRVGNSHSMTLSITVGEVGYYLNNLIWIILPVFYYFRFLSFLKLFKDFLGPPWLYWFETNGTDQHRWKQLVPVPTTVYKISGVWVDSDSTLSESSLFSTRSSNVGFGQNHFLKGKKIEKKEKGETCNVLQLKTKKKREKKKPNH